ncbi:hypothetical protein [Micromonospora inyonensis]|uniref:Uncharacterized protein n=1 Tax=Micromonospora inyonensis TaxID=47866 RepID=A0A1C6RR19_9ACTN|nr:hypothetical protein [Micromonospora inyonensis]SCL19652.1 hypothetical protein GA0074694_2767 [Micromonospora inyonensis]
MTSRPRRGDNGTGCAEADAADGDHRPADALDAPVDPDAMDASTPQRGTEPAEGVRVAPDEPLAVIATGPAGAARRDVLAALLDVPPTTVPMPDDSYLVARYAPETTRAAFVPGYRQPHALTIDVPAAGPAFPRPPRRVELHRPHRCCDTWRWWVRRTPTRWASPGAGCCVRSPAGAARCSW